MKRFREFLTEAEKPWYTARLWLKNGEKADDDFQASHDEEAIKKFKKPLRRPPKGTVAELRRVKEGRHGDTEHVMHHTF